MTEIVLLEGSPRWVVAAWYAFLSPLPNDKVATTRTRCRYVNKIQKLAMYRLKIASSLTAMSADTRLVNCAVERRIEFCDDDGTTGPIVSRAAHSATITSEYIDQYFVFGGGDCAH